MAVKQSYMLKTVIGNNDFELKADPGEAFLVQDIWIIDPAANYVSVKIDRTLVGYFRCGGILGSHLNMHRGVTQHSASLNLADTGALAPSNYQQIKNAGGVDTGLYLANAGTNAGNGTRILDPTRSGDQTLGTLLGLLRSKNLFTGYPVTEGQSFIIEGVKHENSIVMCQYQILEPGDIKPDAPNGSAATEYLFINYGNCGAAIKTEKDNLLDVSKNPAEFPDFPFGKVVPAGHEIDLIGILGSTFAPKENDDTNFSFTKFLKMVKGRETLFDDDRNGILFISRNKTSKGNMDMVSEGWSPIGNYTDEDAKEPFLFPEPLTFLPGDELNVHITLEVGGTGQEIDIDEHEIGFITRVRRAA